MNEANDSDDDVRRTTIEDVAAAAGVSVATVSRALRDLPNVAPSTREKVQLVAAEFSYVADPAAARLAAGRTGTVAVAVPMFDSWYFSKVVAGIEAVLKEANVDLLLYAITSEAERTRFLAGRGAWWRRSDALVMVDVRIEDSEAERLARSGATIVTVGSHTPHFSSITLDERAAALEAAHHLIDAGHQRIAVITGESHALGFRVPILRFEGAREGIVEAGLEFSDDLEVPGGFSVEGGREAMAQLMGMPEPPTAVFAMSDEMAMGALDELRRRGLRAPEDVALVGFDDNDMAELFGLTTVRQDVDTVGATAGRLVLGALADRDAEREHIVTPTYLVIRRTSG